MQEWASLSPLSHAGVTGVVVMDGDLTFRVPEPGFIDNLLSVLFPLRCVHCGAFGYWLCQSCAEALTAIGPENCSRCGRPGLDKVATCAECRGRNLPFGFARAAFRFEGPGRSLVHALKYGGQQRLARLMAAISCSAASLTVPEKDVTLTYVPLHRSKLASRGYNQAELYAKALSRLLDLPLTGLLEKKHPTPPQNRLNSKQRQNNLAGSFALRKEAGPPNSRILLIDDVYTTGSTAAECARVLCGGLGARVDVWTFARTVKE